MTTVKQTDFARNWQEIAANLLKLGATAYGGPAIMGIMQAELQEKRQWVSKERFVEGLSLVNMLPGASAAQLSMFLGYARGGWWGGLLGGLCFVLPGFFILLALTMGYAALGVTPIMRGALYGLGPVVLGIYLVAVYRLGRAAVSTFSQALVAVAAAAAVIFSPIGIAATLLLAGATGVLLFHSTKLGAIVLAALTAVLGLLYISARSTPVPVVAAPLETPLAASLTEVSAFLLKVGTFTFGGGLTMIAAYVGYKVAGIAGAAGGAAAAFLPSFVMMLAVLPVLDHVRKLVWTKAAMRGIGPAVIGMLGVSLVRMAPHALPDVFAAATLIATVIALMVWRVGTVKAMLLGSLLGVLRSRLSSLRAAKGVLYTFTRTLGTAS